ncbi:putative conserved secreted CHAT domain-containing protein [Synechococcus sp. RS9907]|nr:putative conserved secreted CHAT domain-containing protein [Synechococcus sp. RS9907]
MVRLGVGLVLGCGLLLAEGSPVNAGIRSEGKKGLFTKVNGKIDGSCGSGVCKISGGISAGKNLFYRFRKFDTRGKIKGVEFDSIGRKNVIVGVTSPKGSFIDKSIGLSSSASLFWLSPGGIHLSQGASFINVPSLNLSTANTLRFGNGSFDVFRSRASDLTGLSGQPLPGVLGFLVDPDSDLAGGVNRSGIHLDGIDVSIDESLYIDAVDDSLTVRSSVISLDSPHKVGGFLTLTGQSIDVSGVTHLSATGVKGGGVIQVGGSWQNSDPSVRQATTNTVGSDVVIDASAVEAGNGGEIVIWSDINDPVSVTAVAGSLQAHGGVNGGNGGHIETSGFDLDIANMKINVGSLSEFKNGEWLLDPYDYTLNDVSSISAALSEGTNITISTSTSSIPSFEYEDLSSGEYVTTSIGADNPSDSSGGSIVLNDSIIVSGPGSGDLTLQADKKIILNSDITNTTGSGNLTLQSAEGIEMGSRVISGEENYSEISWETSESGSVRLISTSSGGLSGLSSENLIYVSRGSLEIDQAGDSTFPGLIKNVFANTDLTKSGSGRLILSGENSYGGITLIKDGILQITSSDSLGYGSTVFLDGGTLWFSVATSDESSDFLIGTDGGAIGVDLGQSVTLAGVISGSGALTKEGSGTLELSGENTHTGATEVNAGTLLVSGSLSDATAVSVEPGASYELGSDDTVGSLSGAGSVSLNSYQLEAGGDNTSTTFGGVIRGVGGFTKLGTGQLILSGENTYSGATTVQKGSLSIKAPANTSGLLSSTALIVESGSLFKAESGGKTNVGSLAGAGTVEIVSANDVLEVGANNSSTIFSGLITGAGSLAKVGTGTLNLTNDDNDFGSVQGDQQPVVLISDGSLTVDSDGVLGTAVGDVSILVENSAVLGFKGSTTLNSERGIEFGASGGKIEVDSGFTVVIPSSISGATDFEKLGAGTLQLTAANPAFTGTTTVSEGRLNVTSANPTTATCANSASSNLCSSGSDGQSPTPTPDDTEASATLADSGADESTVLEVVQRVDDPSITTVVTSDDEAAATLSPAASSGTESGSSSATDVASGSGSSSSIPVSLSADGVVVELAMESSFSMNSPGDDASSSAVPATTIAGDGSGEVSAATGTESANTESSIDSSSDASAEVGDEVAADNQEPQSDGDEVAADTQEPQSDGVGADDGEAESSKDAGDASGAITPDSDQPRSPAVAVIRVSADQASLNLQNGDAVSTQRAVRGLNLPELSGRSTPSVQVISGFLQQLRQLVANP